jgi:hypothetical protein
VAVVMTTINYKINAKDTPKIFHLFHFKEYYFFSDNKEWCYWDHSQILEQIHWLQGWSNRGPQADEVAHIQIMNQRTMVMGFWRKVLEKFGESGVWLQAVY